MYRFKTNMYTNLRSLIDKLGESSVIQVQTICVHVLKVLHFNQPTLSLL